MVPVGFLDPSGIRVGVSEIPMEFRNFLSSHWNPMGCSGFRRIFWDPVVPVGFWDPSRIPSDFLVFRKIFWDPAVPVGFRDPSGSPVGVSEIPMEFTDFLGSQWDPERFSGIPLDFLGSRRIF